MFLEYDGLAMSCFGTQIKLLFRLVTRWKFVFHLLTCNVDLVLVFSLVAQINIFFDPNMELDQTSLVC